MSGQALGGVFTALGMKLVIIPINESLNNFILILAEVISITFATAATISAFIYFLVGTFVLVISLILYILMSRTIFFKYNTNQATMKSNPLSVNADTTLTSPAITATTMASINRNYLQPDYKKIISKIWIYGFAEWLVFVTTLAVYPAITVLIKSEGKGSHNAWNGKTIDILIYHLDIIINNVFFFLDIYFLPVVNYLLFNSGDYVGRILAGKIKRPQNNPMLIALLTVLRIGFIPAFLLCNITQQHPLPVLIHSDVILILLMTGFSISNGYIANISLICAPT